MLFVDFDAVSWEGVKFRGRACQRRDEEETCIFMYCGVTAIVAVELFMCILR
jgi:hypothetical protein